MFQTAFVTVATTLVYAVPGYLLVKSGKVKKENISVLASILMYICSPCLTIYSFDKATYSLNLFLQMLICLVFVTLAMLFIIFAFRFIFHKKSKEISWRVSAAAVGMGNYSFLGLPILNALLPEHPEAMVFSAAFMVAMNLIAWTVASVIITGDKKYISIKNIFLNPATVSFVITLPLFIFGIKFDGNIILSSLGTVIELLAKMSTALCMILLGMRLASMKFRDVFFNPLSYLTVSFKQIIFPLICYGIALLLPLESYVKISVLILNACPVASVVLNMSELLDRGQEFAASYVLLGTLLSVVTIPTLLLLV